MTPEQFLQEHPNATLKEYVDNVLTPDRVMIDEIKEGLKRKYLGKSVIIRTPNSKIIVTAPLNETAFNGKSMAFQSQDFYEMLFSPLSVSVSLTPCAFDWNLLRDDNSFDKEIITISQCRKIFYDLDKIIKTSTNYLTKRVWSKT